MLQVAVCQFIIGLFRTTFNIISEPVSELHRFYLDFPSEKQPLCSSFCEGCESKKVEFAGKARASRAREKIPPFVAGCVMLDGSCCLSLLWGTLRTVDVLFCNVRMSKMILPKEKSAVFWRFLSLCPQFDPYLLRGCDGGGAIHKKVAPKLGEFRCDRMKVCAWCTKERDVQNERVGD